MEQRFQDLERRLARAERRVQLLSIAGFLLVAGVTIAVAAKPAATQDGEAKEPKVQTVKAPFKVVDSRGKMILDVEDTQGEGRYLRLYDEQESLLAHIGTNLSGGEISVYSPHTHATISAYPDDALISLKGNSPANRATVLLKGTPKGGALVLYARNSKTVVFEKPEGSAPKQR